MAVRTVGRYEIGEEIGRGGTAAVYLAYQTDLRRLVALKELSAFSAADPAFARRFVRESWLIASLSHPSIVTVHEYFEASGAPFIVMEYLPAGSLRSRVGALRPVAVAGVLDGMLGGLAHAHAHGIVHRDLKPENVLVTADGDVKLADFGIAKALDSLDTALTLTGTTIGTPAYMAPEQARAGAVGPWTDLYSLGVVAFELIAGKPPFDDADPVSLLLRHVRDDPPPLRRAAPSTPPPLADWVAGLLAKAPEDRPASAAVAREALEEIVLDMLGPRWRRGAAIGAAAAGPVPASARSTGAIEPMAAATTIPPRVPLPTSATAPPRWRRRWRALLAVVLIGWTIAALLMAAAAALRSTPAPLPGLQPAAGTTPGRAEPAAAPRPRTQPARGVGDSRSDDPSDDAPDGAEP